MGKNIQRTLTLTLTETWTIVWLSDDEPQRQATTIMQDHPKEQPDEALQATLSIAEPAPTPPTPAAVEPQLGAPGGLPADKSTARRRGKHPRLRRAKENRPSK